MAAAVTRPSGPEVEMPTLRRVVHVLALACSTMLGAAAVAQAEAIFLTTVVGGEIYRVDSRTGDVAAIAVGGPPWYTDLVLDPEGVLYTGGFLPVENGVKRFDTRTNTFLPDVGTNVC